MDALLTAIVERQSAMTGEMRQMHSLMMSPMVERDVSSAWAGEEPVWPDEEEPGMMCAPSF